MFEELRAMVGKVKVGSWMQGRRGREGDGGVFEEWRAMERKIRGRKVRVGKVRVQ